MNKVWDRINVLLEKRSDSHCERCGFPVMVERAARHHRRLRSQGGLHLIDNIVLICHGCHQWVHANPRLAERDGWIVPSYADPAERPIRSAAHGMITLRQDGWFDLWFPTQREESDE